MYLCMYQPIATHLISCNWWDCMNPFNFMQSVVLRNIICKTLHGKSGNIFNDLGSKWHLKYHLIRNKPRPQTWTQNLQNPERFHKFNSRTRTIQSLCRCIGLLCQTLIHTNKNMHVLYPTHNTIFFVVIYITLGVCTIQQYNRRQTLWLWSYSTTSVLRPQIYRCTVPSLPEALFKYTFSDFCGIMLGQHHTTYSLKAPLAFKLMGRTLISLTRLLGSNWFAIKIYKIE